MRLLLSKNNIAILGARIICNRINQANPSSSSPFKLCLPTGSTPIAMYQELIRLYNAKQVSFKHVISFNMDEYVGLEHTHPQSYHYYMYNNFFNSIDIQTKNIHILNGMAPDLSAECAKFENEIAKFGGLDLTIGGVGSDGHIAFNEPFSAINSRTRLKTLNTNTQIANSRFFDNVDQIPKQVLTIGIQTILDSKEVIILAKGLDKSHALANAIEGSISSACPLSAIQLHNKALIIADEMAAYELKLKTIRYFESINDEFTVLDQKLDA